MIDRRQFLAATTSCAAQLGLFASLPPLVRRSLGRRAVEPLVVEPWARLEAVGDSVWAAISTPLASDADARRTVSNGGIIAGKSGVLLVEGTASDAGAQWMLDMARARTGRTPTHVVLTHYHGDHSNGLAAYGTGGDAKPVYVTTEATRQSLATARPPIADLLAGAELVEAGKTHSIDLGGRNVTVTPRSGHTNSDLTVTVDEPAVVFGGDLVWNAMFPNYVDAIPSVLSREVRAVGKDAAKAVIVPGHGVIPSREQFARYVELLDLIEDTAKRAHAAGRSPAEAAAGVAFPTALGEWTMFSPRYVQVALEAWERELAGPKH